MATFEENQPIPFEEGDHTEPSGPQVCSNLQNRLLWTFTRRLIAGLYVTVSYRPVTNTKCSDLGSSESEDFGTLAAVVLEQHENSFSPGPGVVRPGSLWASGQGT